MIISKCNDQKYIMESCIKCFIKEHKIIYKERRKGNEDNN